MTKKNTKPHVKIDYSSSLGLGVTVKYFDPHINGVITETNYYKHTPEVYNALGNHEHLRTVFDYEIDSEVRKVFGLPDGVLEKHMQECVREAEFKGKKDEIKKRYERSHALRCIASYLIGFTASVVFLINERSDSRELESLGHTPEVQEYFVMTNVADNFDKYNGILKRYGSFDCGEECSRNITANIKQDYENLSVKSRQLLGYAEELETAVRMKRAELTSNSRVQRYISLREDKGYINITDSVGSLAIFGSVVGLNSVLSRVLKRRKDAKLSSLEKITIGESK